MALGHSGVDSPRSARHAHGVAAGRNSRFTIHSHRRDAHSSPCRSAPGNCCRIGCRHRLLVPRLAVQHRDQASGLLRLHGPTRGIDVPQVRHQIRRHAGRMARIPSPRRSGRGLSIQAHRVQSEATTSEDHDHRAGAWPTVRPVCTTSKLGFVRRQPSVRQKKTPPSPFRSRTSVQARHRCIDSCGQNILQMGGSTRRRLPGRSALQFPGLLVLLGQQILEPHHGALPDVDPQGAVGLLRSLCDEYRVDTGNGACHCCRSGLRRPQGPARSPGCQLSPQRSVEGPARDSSACSSGPPHAGSTPPDTLKPTTDPAPLRATQADHFRQTGMQATTSVTLTAERS